MVLPENGERGRNLLRVLWGILRHSRKTIFVNAQEEGADVRIVSQRSDPTCKNDVKSDVIL